MADAYPPWAFDLDHEVYKEQAVGVLSLIYIAWSFMILVRKGKCSWPQLRSFIDMLLRQPKSANLRKMLKGILPELHVEMNEDFSCTSTGHRYLVECMRPDTDDPSPVNDISMVDDDIIEPISPDGKIFHRKAYAQLWQILYREAALEEKEKKKAMKGKGKETDMGKEAKGKEPTEKKDGMGKEAMVRMKNLAITLLNEEDIDAGMAKMGMQAWRQALKEETEYERMEEMVLTKLKELIRIVFQLRQQKLEMGTEVKDGSVDGKENEEKGIMTKGKKAKKQSNRRKKR